MKAELAQSRGGNSLLTAECFVPPQAVSIIVGATGGGGHLHVGFNKWASARVQGAFAYPDLVRDRCGSALLKLSGNGQCKTHQQNGVKILTTRNQWDVSRGEVGARDDRTQPDSRLVRFWPSCLLYHSQRLSAQRSATDIPPPRPFFIPQNSVMSLKIPIHQHFVTCGVGLPRPMPESA